MSGEGFGTITISGPGGSYTLPHNASSADVGEAVSAAAREWQRGDVVLDDSGNLFCYHDKHGWFGLASNQCSARGPHERGELADPLVLLVRDRKAVCVPPCSKEHR